MNIRSVKIIEDKLLLQGKSRDRYLMDGVYRNDDGVSITVRGNMIVSMLAVPDFAKAQKEQLEKYIAELEQELSSVDEENKMAYSDLQNALQRQSQTIQMLSNVSKILHDTAKAVIEKIG